jgi:hypothetical protein
LDYDRAWCARIVATGFILADVKPLSYWPKVFHLGLSIAALVLSWMLMQTDFAYYSFVVGMTSQVSDVPVTAAQMRRTMLAHGVLSFLFNIAVLAMSMQRNQRRHLVPLPRRKTCSRRCGCAASPSSTWSMCRSPDGRRLGRLRNPRY